MTKIFIYLNHLIKIMHIKEKKILYELDLSARSSFSELGKKIGLSKETTNNRIRSLEKKGIITGYNAIINIAQLGYSGYAVFSRFENITEERKKELIDELKRDDNVYWVALLGGNYDLLFAIQAKNIVEFNRVYAKLQNRYHDCLKDNIISIRSQVSQFRRKYLLGDSKIEKIPYFGKEITATDIDDAGKSLLNILSGDARLTVVELAEKLNMARTTIHNRLGNLEKSGIIQGYSALIHPEKYGYQVYQLMLNVKSIDDNTKKSIYNYCMTHPNITFYVDSVGKWNFEITCEVEDQKMLQEIITDIRTKFSDIILNIEIIMTFNYYVKYRLHA